MFILYSLNISYKSQQLFIVFYKFILSVTNPLRDKFVLGSIFFISLYAFGIVLILGTLLLVWLSKIIPLFLIIVVDNIIGVD